MRQVVYNWHAKEEHVRLGWEVQHRMHWIVCSHVSGSGFCQATAWLRIGSTLDALKCRLQVNDL
ncbi:hypothetical protein CROQUDRAFT_44915 [Cronartium quercuum f. sp. fusiforme G11]|uniref:Uncharacterized protein n=1 Tax=Cronartium quercuum f. sp. fusiforme G11 TaxID=708437 RepID=A0A9P6NFU3_9BASI|nr:hypothetical protein CROQUDRAFT_44915 [Cronartium quercuum f. sp. fusiforme G11]